MGKLTLTEHLKACAEAAKNFTSGLVGEEAMNEMNEVKADKPDYAAVTIPTTGWQEDESVAAYPVYYDIVVEGVTANDRATVVIAPGSMAAAVACAMCPSCETVTGAIRIRAGSAPSTAISAEYWLDQGKE